MLRTEKAGRTSRGNKKNLDSLFNFLFHFLIRVISFSILTVCFILYQTRKKIVSMTGWKKYTYAINIKTRNR